MVDAIVLWIHILAAAIFVGPQVFLAAVAMPAVRSVEDAKARQQVVRGITRGFGVLGGLALVVLIATGFWNYYAEPYSDFIDARGRYFTILNIKLTLVTVIVVLTAVHGMVFGRRLQVLQETGGSEEEIARTRMWSMAASMANIAASIGVLLCAALLASNWGRSIRS